MASVFACRLGLLAFAATSLDAAWSGSDLAGGVTTALVRTVLFYGLGFVCGTTVGWLAEEQAQQQFEHWKAAADAPPATAS